ncbi:hypothetical protein GPN2_13046 [Streptomyces murinus]
MDGSGRNVSDLELLTQSLARNVRHWRSVRGFTLDVLAARAGVSRGMLIQIEQARTSEHRHHRQDRRRARRQRHHPARLRARPPGPHRPRRTGGTALAHHVRQLQPAARGHRGARPAGDLGLGADARGRARRNRTRPAPWNWSMSRRAS